MDKDADWSNIPIIQCWLKTKMKNFPQWSQYRMEWDDLTQQGRGNWSIIKVQWIIQILLKAPWSCTHLHALQWHIALLCREKKNPCLRFKCSLTSSSPIFRDECSTLTTMKADCCCNASNLATQYLSRDLSYFSEIPLKELRKQQGKPIKVRVALVKEFAIMTFFMENLRI